MIEGWEYKMEVVNYNEAEKAVNDLGRDGWEVIVISEPRQDTTGWKLVVWLKRKVRNV